MGTICNFGENELPRFFLGDDVCLDDDRSSFDYYIRCLEQNVRDMESLNPSFMQKVDILAERYSLSQLNSALEDIKCDRIVIERAYTKGCLSAEESCHLKDVILRSVAIEFAIKRKEQTNEFN